MEQKVFYGIKNSTGEVGSRWTGFATTLESIEKVLRRCNDWYQSKGTGTVYRIDCIIFDNGVMGFKAYEIYRVWSSGSKLIKEIYPKKG